jgi:radical SAM superfamily enzyme YgiQ (UPF0313 family)
MYFGVESGSQKVLNILNKSIKIKDIIRSAEITNDIGIIADYSWMIGIPGEDKLDLQKTITLIKKVKNINPNSEFSIKILFPYPKTEIFNHAINQGFKPPSNLLGWSKIRRERAPSYLNNKNTLETISITSAIVGRKVFEQQNAPVFKLIKSPAKFRWNKEIFGAGIENILFKVFRSIIDKVISRKGPLEYDLFSQEIVPAN